MSNRRVVLYALAILAGVLLYTLLAFMQPAETEAVCEAEPITANTPTGIAGCEVWGEGTASHYGAGDGVAMNFCTWKLRHRSGCGEVQITSLQTGITVIRPVIDFCDCYTGTADQRIVDLQWGVVDALGLARSQGLYPVRVVRVSGAVGPIATPPPRMLPNTAMR